MSEGKTYTVPLAANGSVDVDALEKKDLYGLYERELDLAHTKTSSAGARTPGAREQEAFERECEQWREALRCRVRDELTPQNICIERVLWHQVEGEFKVVATDAAYSYRDYSVTISVSSALALAELHDREPLAAVVKDVCQRILEARDHYFRRMQ